jgi:Bacteriocin-protection, YdeI or OmpD-Associated/Domain of unknown function (DUF1905)
MTTLPYERTTDGVRFRTNLTQDEKSETCAVVLPFDPKDVFGKTRLPVHVTLNGKPFRTTTFKMAGTIFFAVNREMREAAGVRAGDEVEVTLRPDTEERTVEIPPALAAALAEHPAEKAYFDSLSFTHRKEFARWIDSAKKEDTRASRVVKCIAMLRAKEKPHF